MRAVNLVPSDRGGGGIRSATPLQASIYVAIGFLAGVLGLVTVYVLAQNKISAGQAQLVAVQQQSGQETALAARLQSFTQFASLARTRVSTVRGIADARFDWHLVLSDLAKVVPPTVALQTFNGTVAAGATAGTSGSGVGASAGLRSEVATPAVELTGCSTSQDDVARLMSRLRVMDGVTRVTPGSSQKSDTGGGTGGQGCPAGKPAFDLVIFYQPLPQAGATGVVSTSAPVTAGSAATPATTPVPASTTPGSATTPVPASTTPGSARRPAGTSTPGTTSTRSAAPQ